MAAFTLVADMAGDLSKKTYLDEIVNGCIERIKAVTATTYITAIDLTNHNNDDFHGNSISTSLWSFKSLQLAIEAICVYYIDHTITIAGSTAINTYTWSTFKIRAGLSNGWRRATTWDGVNDPAWSYGNPIDNDIAGWWLIEDIQKALKALKWIYYSNTAITDGYSKSGEVDTDFDPDNDTTCSECLTELKSQFSTAWVSASSGLEISRRIYYVSIGDPPPVGFEGYIGDVKSIKGKPIHNGPWFSTSPLQFDWVCYLKFGNDTDLTFTDFHGDGFNLNQYKEWSTGAITNVADKPTGALFDTTDTCPLDMSPAVSCPISGSSDRKGMVLDDIAWIIKRRFSHT